MPVVLPQAVPLQGHAAYVLAHCSCGRPPHRRPPATSHAGLPPQSVGEHFEVSWICRHSSCKPTAEHGIRTAQHDLRIGVLSDFATRRAIGRPVCTGPICTTRHRPRSKFGRSCAVVTMLVHEYASTCGTTWPVAQKRDDRFLPEFGALPDPLETTAKLAGASDGDAPRWLPRWVVLQDHPAFPPATRESPAHGRESRGSAQPSPTVRTTLTRVCPGYGVDDPRHPNPRSRGDQYFQARYR